MATEWMGVLIYSFCVHKTGYFAEKLAIEWMGVPIYSFCVHKTGYFAEKLATEWMGVLICSFCVHKTRVFTQKLATEWMTRPFHSFCGTKMSRRRSIAMIPRVAAGTEGFSSALLGPACTEDFLRHCQGRQFGGVILGRQQEPPKDLLLADGK